MLAAVGFGPIFSDPEPTILSVTPQTGAIQGRVRVVDGDTYDVGAVRVRLQGVDTPEPHQRCVGEDGPYWRCGDWATQQVRELIGSSQLTCVDLGEMNRDRVIASCTLDGIDLGAALVSAGIARACPRYSRQRQHSSGYETLEERAIQARLGLHAGFTPPLAEFCLDHGTPGAAPLAPTFVQADECWIKGNISRSGESIYHVPGQRDYDSTVITPTRGERWFCSEEEARAAGWRRARR